MGNWKTVGDLMPPGETLRKKDPPLRMRRGHVFNR